MNAVFIILLIFIQSWPKISAPLVNMIQEGCENKLALLIILIFYLKKSQKSNLSLNNKNLKWGKISLWNKCFFSNTHWPQLTAPFYSILFETSIHQLNSSKCSPIMNDEVQEHLTRDQRPLLHPESLQILQFNSSKCSSIMNDEVREHLTRDQRPLLHPESLQILQIHSSMMVLLLFSSPHSSSTGFRSEVRNGHSRSLLLCSVTHFCVVFKVDTLLGSFETFYINWKFLFIVLMVKMGIFAALALFLKPLHSFVKLKYLLLPIRKILLVFSHCDGGLREFRLCFPSYLYFSETGSHVWIMSCSLSPWSAQNCEYEWEYTSEIFY